MRARPETPSERLVTMLTDLADWNEAMTYSVSVRLTPANEFVWEVRFQSGADRSDALIVDAPDVDRLVAALADKLRLWGTPDRVQQAVRRR